MKYKPLIAYGDQEDRDKAAVLAAYERISASASLLKAIRDAYARRFGANAAETALTKAN